MVVGVLQLELRLPATHSLKGKRGILRTIKARVRNRFNVSIAECGAHDAWQRTLLGVAQAGVDEPHVAACLGEVIRFIEGLHLTTLGAERIEYLHYGNDLDG